MGRIDSSRFGRVTTVGPLSSSTKTHVATLAARKDFISIFRVKRMISLTLYIHYTSPSHLSASARLFVLALHAYLSQSSRLVQCLLVTLLPSTSDSYFPSVIFCTLLRSTCAHIFITCRYFPSVICYTLLRSTCAHLFITCRYFPSVICYTLIRSTCPHLFITCRYFPSVICYTL